MSAHEALLQQARSRTLIYVSEVVYSYFWERWREIDQEWLGCGLTPEALDAFPVIQAAREDLRSQVAAVCKQGYGGNYPLVV